MNPDQRSAIIGHVKEGRTWGQAAELAGIKAERFLQYVLDIKSGRLKEHAPFLVELERAGKYTTNQSLSTTRKELKVPKNDSGQVENNEETTIYKRRPYFRRLVNLTDLRKVQTKLLRMFLNGELDEKTYRACVYGTTAIGTTMRYIDQQKVEAKQAGHGLLFGRLTATGEFNEPFGSVYLGMGNEGEQITEQEAVE